MSDDLKHYIKRFKRVYDNAREAKRTQFTFDGHPVLVAYAKYYLEYLEGLQERREQHG
jgi:hypothetical protein